jgi:hypothetical protein
MDRMSANNRANERRNVRFRGKADKVDGRDWGRAQLDDLIASYLDDDICAQKEVDQDQSPRWRLKSRYQDNGGSNHGGYPNIPRNQSKHGLPLFVSLRTSWGPKAMCVLRR